MCIYMIMRCKVCGEDKEEKYFKKTFIEKSQKFSYLKKCKMCYGTTKIREKPNQFGELRCNTCDVYREEKYFRTSIVSDKLYYATKKCKVCLGINVRETKYIISNEGLLFLDRLDMMRGYVDMVDAYKLAHFFTETFGYIEHNVDTIEEDLIIMYNKLKRLRDDNRPT